MRFSPLFVLLFFALAAYGQQERVAILNTVDDRDSIGFSELSHLTNRLRETAVKVLPKQRYGVMTTESIVAFLGSQENARKVCNESSCLAEVGRKVSADYVAQARVGRFGNQLSINFQLYNTKTGNLVDSFTGNSKDIFGLLAIIDEKAPDLFKQMLGTSSGSKAPSVAGGISGLQKTAAYEADGEKLYLVNLNTEPSGAALSFDGVPSCPKTPCKVELRSSVRIIAALEQYETADTTVSIKQNNQNITITLKPNFGILEIKPAYSDGIGKDKQWNLSINDKSYSLGEVRLSPNKYAVKLNHECYENIGFDVGINKGKREVFDMASNITLKKGGLTLRAELDGEPVSEVVYVNGARVGETPFNGSVPLCARIEVGNGKEVVDVKLKYNEKIKHTYRFNTNLSKNVPLTTNVTVGSGSSFTDSRDNKTYKMVKIGNQTWMAENLNYAAESSKCYNDSTAYCQKYGRLYNWNTAKTACPPSWHLPSDAEWNVLMSSVGGEKTAGKFLKATSGWNENGNGTDKFGFSALPGGIGYSGGSFGNVGSYGLWWSASGSSSYYACRRGMGYDYENAYYDYNIDKSFLFSVRCVKD